MACLVAVYTLRPGYGWLVATLVTLISLPRDCLRRGRQCLVTLRHPTRLVVTTAEHQFAPIRAGDSGNNMGGETSKACVTGADGGNTAKTSNSQAGSGSSDTEIKNQL